MQHRQHLRANLCSRKRQIVIRRVSCPFPVAYIANGLARRARLHQHWPHQRHTITKIARGRHARQSAGPRTAHQPHQHRLQHIIRMMRRRDKSALASPGQFAQLPIPLRASASFQIPRSAPHLHPLVQHFHAQPRPQLLHQRKVRLRLLGRPHVMHDVPKHQSTIRPRHRRGERQRHRRRIRSTRHGQQRPPIIILAFAAIRQVAPRASDLPQGSLGRSGRQKPAGSDAPRMHASIV